MQVSATLQTPERHTALVWAVQLPAPLASPHFASVSQTPERQTTEAVEASQLPSLLA
jgi:hypothetical protein